MRHFPIVQCKCDTPHHNLLAETMRTMTPARGIPMPYSYELWLYVHFIRGQVLWDKTVRVLVKVDHL